MKSRLFWLSVCLGLAACGAPVETVTVLPDQEYEISTRPPAGMYGSWLALAPASNEALDREASARCPHGYRKANLEQGNGRLWTDFVRWDILCEPLNPS
jgi:hypothetical protein